MVKFSVTKIFSDKNKKILGQGKKRIENESNP